MPNKEDGNRHRMVVEEVGTKELPAVEEIKEEVKEEIVAIEVKPDILDEGVKEEAPKPVTEKSPEITKQKSPVAWILIPGIFILGAILGGVVFYQKGVNTGKVEETPTPTISAVATPSPSSSPAATIDVSKFDVAIFNGSGIAGEAGKAKDLLVKAGFNVTSTGNAATYDYTKTIIKAKATVDASVIEKVKTALSKTYVVGDNQTLSSSSTTDIQIVVGTSKAE